MNVAVITGNIGSVNELRVLQNGTPILGFSVAVSKKRKGEKVTTWFDCGLFGQRAEKVHPYIRKGDKITVSGEVTARAYMDKSGQPRADLKIFVQDFTLIGGGQGGQQHQTPSQPRQPAQHPAQDGGDIPDFDDGNIPF